MIRNTLIIVGPGGIGKSPLDSIIKQDALRIDPYRLRATGPRDSNDIFYAHPKLRDELYLTYQRLSLSLSCLSEIVHWFPQAMTVFLRVRKDWQILFLEGLAADIAKAEVYAPAVPVLLANPQVRHVFGTISMVMLNPVDELKKLDTWDELKKRTKENCELRGDDSQSVMKRVASIDEEAPAWRQMVEMGATEFYNWQFPEYMYSRGDRKDTLIRARRALLSRNPTLEIFLKTEEEIRKDP